MTAGSDEKPDGSDQKPDGEHPDLPPTEAMPTQWRPYQAAPPPLIQPPARQPFPWEQQAPPAPAFPWDQPVERSAAPVPPRVPAPEPAEPPATVRMERPTVNAPAADAGVGAESSELDELFGESAFQTYEEESVFAAARRAPAELRPRRERAPRDSSPAGSGAAVSAVSVATTHRALIAAAIALVALLVLVLIFSLGFRNASAILPAAAEPAPAVTGEPAEPDVVLGTPVEPGVYEWNQLAGTECIEPYVSAWEQQYTVVECTEPHGGQLVTRGVFDDEAASAWPGLEELESRVSSLCTPQSVLDYSLAREYTDLAVAASYAATAAAWDAGDRDYYCFVSRTSGEPLTASLAR